ncbi:MAG TPA: cytochrome b/b6 domain-containing protein [Microbacterium sp.]|nr:cytochrome b/b6 domain-containing protein [Microbacterium sp.]
MATYAQTVRRGLPRRPGGDPWPPADVALAALGVEAPELVRVSAEPDAGSAEPPEASAQIVEVSSLAAVSVDGATPAVVGSERIDDVTAREAPASRAAGDGVRMVRRGLPRVPGGEPWPSAASVPVHLSPVLADPAETRAPVTDEAVVEAPTTAERVSAAVTPAPAIVGVTSESGRPLRRGLPRVAGGEPWPAAGSAPRAPAETEVAVSAVPEPGIRQGLTPTRPAAAPASADLSIPLPFTRTVFPGRAAVEFERERLSGERIVTPEPQRIGPFTRLQWAGAVIVGGAGLLFAAGMAVVAVRWLLSMEPMQEFLAAYPGEYPLPEGAPVGIPPWLGWQHFFNVFLIVLIIRSGLQVRTEKRPSVFWSPRSNGKRKISLNLWFHQSLDLLWVTNGVIFVVLLFATGQWMKIVPTSWAVFPNALSAALQYVSLDWPTENGWVNYNSLQQLAYFATVFIAAPLAIATGVRMSGIWPKNATALSRAYPVEWARAIHFPVMLYFVVFIAIHVFLVFATGALRNLNHMYASQGSTDPNAYADNWLGFWLFAASLLVIAAAWVAARPLVLAPIARLFGTVSGR